MRQWPVIRWVLAIVGAAVSLVMIGIPTSIIHTPWYTRMTPVLVWNYPIWIASAVLCGLIFATYVRTAAPAVAPSRAGVGGGLLSLLAVGCPTCNQFVVMAVGVTGALNYWAPLQPVLGLASVALLVWALNRRLTGERQCAIASPARRMQSVGDQT